MATDPIVILSTARTPMGSMQGSLSDASATDLGATAVRAAVAETGRRCAGLPLFLRYRWTWLLLSQHPSIREKLTRELDEVLPPDPRAREARPLRG